MKKNKQPAVFSYDNLTLRKLARLRMAPPSRFFVDRKKQNRKNNCRGPI
jgi:hypothetical protein